MQKSIRYLLSIALFSSSLFAGLIEAEKIVQGSGDGSLAFGYSLDIDGSYAIVGAPNEANINSNDGSVYIFKKNASGNFEFFFNIEGSNKGAFGTDVAVSDTGAGEVLIAIGEPTYEFYNAKTGDTTYNDVLNIYKLNDAGSSFVAIHTFYDINGTGLGTSVDIANTIETVDTQSPAGIIDTFTGFIIVAGAPGANKAYTHFYKYPADSWSTLELSEGTTLDKFGYSVAIKNKYPYSNYGTAKVIIGAPDDDIYDPYRDKNLAQRGSVHIYDLNGTFANNDFSWINRAELTQGIPAYLLINTQPNEHTHFGKAVDILNDRAIVGASGISIGSSIAPLLTPTIGEVRIFALSDYTTNTWISNGLLYAANSDILSFGSAVALSAHKTAIVGAPDTEKGVNIVGAIFTYEYDAASAHWDEKGALFGRESGHFGTCVDFMDTTPIVGNPSKDTLSILKYNDANPSLIMYLLN